MSQQSEKVTYNVCSSTGRCSILFGLNFHTFISFLLHNPVLLALFPLEYPGFHKIFPDIIESATFRTKHPDQGLFKTLKDVHFKDIFENVGHWIWRL